MWNSSHRSSASGALLLLLLAACSQTTPIQPAGALLLGELSSDSETQRRDAADIMAAHIDGDLLHVDVQFGGGCADHEFSLLHFGGFRESFPVQTDIRLMHDANGDPCRALLGRSLSFDLTPIRERYQRSYASETGAIDLHLHAPGESNTSARVLRYEF